MLRNTDSAYGAVSITLHWLMALAIFAMFALGLWMKTLDYYHSWYHRAPYIHKSIGMLLLGLLLFRMLWTWMNTKPVIYGRAWERTAGLTVHRLHYVLMLLVMLSGYLIPTAKGIGVEVFGWFTVPALTTLAPRQQDADGLAHWLTAWAMTGLALLHSAAALKHHFVDRDATLLRMLGMTRAAAGGKR